MPPAERIEKLGRDGGGNRRAENEGERKPAHANIVKSSSVSSVSSPSTVVYALQTPDKKIDIKAFEKEAKSGSNPEIKQFAADAVPTLKGHLSMAQSAKRAASGHHTGTHTSALDNGDASQSTEQRSNRDSTVQGKNTQINPPELKNK